MKGSVMVRQLAFVLATACTLSAAGRGCMISVPTGRHERGRRGGGHHAVRGIREVQGEVRESAPPREPEPARLSLTEGCRSANCRLELNYGMQEEVGEQPSSKPTNCTGVAECHGRVHLQI